jgi:hypothetical protein
LDKVYVFCLFTPACRIAGVIQETRCFDNFTQNYQFNSGAVRWFFLMNGGDEMSKLTPEQAWVHVKALWPDAEYIRKGCQKLSTDGVYRGRDIDSFIPLHHCNIDWPEGVTQWPPNEEWRDAVVPTIGKFEDWGLPCRVRDSESDPWFKSKILGYDESFESSPWMIEDDCFYRDCQVRVTARDKTPPDADHVSANVPERETIKEPLP